MFHPLHSIAMKVFLVLMGVFILVVCAKQSEGQVFAPVTIDQGSSLMRGLQHWWVVLPTFRGGVSWPNRGSARGTATLTNMGSGSGWTASVRGRAFGAMRFDGTDDYIQSSTAAGVVFNAPFTVCLWVFSTAGGSGGAGRALLRMSNTNGFSGVMLHWGDNNSGSQIQRPAFNIDSDAGAFEGIRVNADRPLSTWEHICALYDGSQTVAGMSIVINGDTVGTSVENNTGFGAFTANTWRIGANNNAAISEFFQGAMDDIRVYGRLLSIAEIRTIWQTGAPLVPQRGFEVPLTGSVPPASTGGRKIRIQN